MVGPVALASGVAVAFGCGTHSDVRSDARVPDVSEDGGGSSNSDAAVGPRVLVWDLGDKALSTIRDGYLYFKPGFYRLALNAPRAADGRIAPSAVEKIWPEAGTYADTMFVDGMAYWIGQRALFEWPLAGGEVKRTELPPVNWYSLAANDRYLFVATLGCERILRMDRATGEVLDKASLVVPRSPEGPNLYASNKRVYCTATYDGRLWSVNVDLQDLRTHVQLEPSESVRLSLADAGFLYFYEEFAARGRVLRMNLESESIELLDEGPWWALSQLRKLDERRIAWLTAHAMRVLDVPSHEAREFVDERYFKVGDVTRPGGDLLFDADNVFWFRIDQGGGHLMVTPRAYFGI